MSTVEFEQWLEAHLPDAANSLNARANDDDWVRLEEESGLRLPGGFISLYRWHDGQSRTCPTGIFYGLRFLPLAEVLQEWRYWSELADREPARTPAATDLVQPGSANKHWIPFATDDSGNFLAIDLEPGPAGHYGQVINMGRDEHQHFALAEDVLEFVAWLLREVKGGNHSIVDEGGGFSFNTLRPPSGHFLDAAKEIFGNAKPRAAQSPSAPPRDSTIGTFLFIRSELARHATPDWKTIVVEANISGTNAKRNVTLSHRFTKGGEPIELRIDDAHALIQAFIELQDRTAEESWKWCRMKLEFDVDNENRFLSDSD